MVLYYSDIMLYYTILQAWPRSASGARTSVSSSWMSWSILSGCACLAVVLIVVIVIVF